MPEPSGAARRVCHPDRRPANYNGAAPRRRRHLRVLSEGRDDQCPIKRRPGQSRSTYSPARGGCRWALSKRALTLSRPSTSTRFTLLRTSTTSRKPRSCVAMSRPCEARTWWTRLAAISMLRGGPGPARWTASPEARVAKASPQSAAAIQMTRAILSSWSSPASSPKCSHGASSWRTFRGCSGLRTTRSVDDCFPRCATRGSRSMTTLGSSMPTTSEFHSAGVESSSWGLEAISLVQSCRRALSTSPRRTPLATFSRFVVSRRSRMTTSLSCRAPN